MKRFFSVLLLCAWATVMNAQPQIWYVSPNGIGTGTSWPDSCSLQYALQNASSEDEIWVKKGYYYGNLEINVNLTIRGGFAGTEAQLQDRAPLTTMDINTAFSTNYFSILDATDSGRSVVRVDCDRFVMDRFTLTGGDTNFGGGFFMLNHAYLNLKDMNVCNNEVQNESGGLYIDQVDSVRIENIVIYNNTAHSRGGGIVFVQCDDLLLLANALILKNHADNYGGGLVFENTGAWVVNNTIVCNSTNGQGSAVSLDCSHPAFHSTILWNNIILGGHEGFTVYQHSLPSYITYYSCCVNCDNNPFVDFPNDDYRLMPIVNNPCINTGMWPSGIPFNSITTDLDHYPRVSNGNDPNPDPNNNKVDIGAYEVQPQQ